MAVIFPIAFTNITHLSPIALLNLIRCSTLFASLCGILSICSKEDEISNTRRIRTAQQLTNTFLQNYRDIFHSVGKENKSNSTKSRSTIGGRKENSTLSKFTAIKDATRFARNRTFIGYAN